MRSIAIKPDGMVLRIVRAAFPEYKGRKFYLSPDVPARIESYWDEGSRSYYAFYELATGKLLEVESNHPWYERGRPRDLPEAGLPPGVVLVERWISRGKDVGITIYARQEDLVPLLPPAQAEPTEDEKLVLKYTRALKPNYNGISNYRFHEAHRYTGITSERWESAKKALIERKLLNKAGALTIEGKNAARDLR
jgi:hypothetical protein